MNLSRSDFKYLPGVLLFLLIVCSVLIFGSYHNLLISSGIKSTSGWSIFFLILIIVIGILYYLLLNNANNKSKDLEKTIFAFEKSIEESKHKEVKVEEVVKEKIDFAKVTKAIIPENTNDLIKFGETFLSNISHRFEIAQGQFYMKDKSSGIFSFISGYAYYSESEPITYKEGETLAGQAAKNKTVLNISNVPDNHITILSGLGKGTPDHLLIVPIISSDNETIGIFEIASFKPFDSEVEKLFAYLGHQLGDKLIQPTKP